MSMFTGCSLPEACQVVKSKISGLSLRSQITQQKQNSSIKMTRKDRKDSRNMGLSGAELSGVGCSRFQCFCECLTDELLPETVSTLSL